MLPRPSIGMVAAQARVSTKTVSRVINNADCVTPRMREHVMHVIRQLSYSPSPTARSLRGHRSFLVGLPFDNPYATYVTEIQSGSLSTCRADNYQLVMHACDSRAAHLAEEIRLFVQRVRVDGVILSPPLSDRDDVMDALKSEAIPFVRVAPARRFDLTHSVFTNDRQICAKMTEHLGALGHGRIGFVRGHAEHPASEQRYMGYCQGLHALGLRIDSQRVSQGADTFESGLQCALALLKMPVEQRPTAIFAGNDAMAAGVLSAAHALGVAVPDELSVAGFEDAPLAKQVWPRLTTVRQPLRAMAEQAAALLLAQLRGAPAERLEHLVESSLILRQSTARVQQNRREP